MVNYLLDTTIDDIATDFIYRSIVLYYFTLVIYYFKST